MGDRKRRIPRHNGKRDARVDDVLHRFRVGEEIELGETGDVSGLDRSSHCDDPPYQVPELGVQVHRHRNIRERPECEQGKAGILPGQTVDAGRRALRVLDNAGRGQLDPAQAVCAMDTLCPMCLLHKGPRGAAEDRDVRSVQEAEQTRHIVHHAREGDVSRHRRDADHFQLGARQRNHDGNGIVDAAVSVDQNLFYAHADENTLYEAGAKG